MTTPQSTDDRLSVAQLEEMASAPDLTKRERRELAKAIRFQRRVELWEERRRGPQPRKLHRAIITLAMMAACIGLLVFLNTSPS